MDNFFSLYGAVALTHFGAQMAFAHMEHRRQRVKDPVLRKLPRVGIVIPVYNEDPEVLRQCLQSVLYLGFPVVLVDDGSTLYKEEYDKLVDAPKESGLVFFRNHANTGKRACQKQAFDFLNGNVDYFVTIDSDTVVSLGSVEALVAPLQDNFRVGAVTGHVQVTNEKDNVLTRIISSRYWNAFNQERAAQSYFGVVFCCSGPFSAYRADVVNEVKEEYVNQKFLGSRCGFGDDRHLTNLILREGYKVKYAEHATAHTLVPDNLKQYGRQQLRWSKSFIREIFWTLPNLFRHNLYFAYDFLLQLILPIVLIIALIHAVTIGIDRPATLVGYIGVILLIALVRATYAILRTRKLMFLIFGIYGFIYVFFLIPIKMYALATVRNNGWGTR